MSSIHPGAFRRYFVNSKDCETKITPNSDISGVGILISIFVQSWVVVVVSLYRWGLGLRLTYAQASALSLSPFRRFLYICDHLEDFKTNRIVSTLYKMLCMFSDVQSILGCSLIIATLSQYNSIPLFHLFIVWQFCLLVTLSHYAAFHFTFLAFCSVPYWKPRLAIVCLYLSLLVALAILARHKFFAWNNEIPNECYWYQSYWPLDQTFWFIIDFFWNREPYFVYFILPIVLWVKRYSGEAKTPLAAVLVMGKYLWMILDGPVTFGPFMIWWLANNAYNLLGAYIPSLPLLGAEQTQWGFGQVTAMCAVPGVIFGAWQIWKDGTRDSHGDVESQVEPDHSVVSPPVAQASENCPEAAFSSRNGTSPGPAHFTTDDSHSHVESQRGRSRRSVASQNDVAAQGSRSRQETKLASMSAASAPMDALEGMEDTSDGREEPPVHVETELERGSMASRNHSPVITDSPENGWEAAPSRLFANCGVRCVGQKTGPVRACTW